MSEPYPDFVARFYDAVYAQLRDDVDNDYYLRKIMAAVGPVLEIGVGTGRLFAEGLRRGADIHGVDLSSHMVERCRERLAPGDRQRVWVDDAVHLRTDRRFGLVVAPFRVLSHIPEPEDQLRLMNSVHGLLDPGGIFIFDVYVPNLKLLLEGLPETCDFDGEHSPGRRLRRLVSAVPADLARQTSRVRMQFEWDDDGGKQRDEWTFDMRYFFRFELEHLMERSRLQLEALHGDFEEGPLTPESADYVIVARRDG